MFQFYYLQGNTMGKRRWRSCPNNRRKKVLIKLAVHLAHFRQIAIAVHPQTIKALRLKRNDDGSEEEDEEEMACLPLFKGRLSTRRCRMMLMTFSHHSPCPNSKCCSLLVCHSASRARRGGLIIFSLSLAIKCHTTH